jgi:hypothetical protein
MLKENWITREVSQLLSDRSREFYMEEVEEGMNTRSHLTIDVTR